MKGTAHGLDRPPIKGEQRLALLHLQTEITAHDWAVPCVQSRLWISDHDADQEHAAELCGPCPVIAECRAYINRFPREQGVYAGTTYFERNHHGRR